MTPYIACDLDGCVYPFVTEFRTLASTYTDALITHDSWIDFAQWRFYEDWDKDEQWFRDRYSEWFQQGYLLRDGEPISRLHDKVMDHMEVHWITHREIDDVPPAAVRATTQRWLERNGFPGVLHLATKDRRKADIITELESSGRHCIGVIEDHPGNCAEMARAAGCMGVVINRPYNMNVDPDHAFLKRAMSVLAASAAIWHTYMADYALTTDDVWSM